MYIKVLTVSSLNNYIKKVMDSDFILSNIHVKGEISNLKVHNSGHIYFSLKDEFGKINAVMFRSDAERLSFNLKDGMNVEALGRVSLYVKEGSYQLYCSEIVQIGLGDLYVAFVKLKERLEKEGLFSEEHKKNIPSYPRRIGVVTSATGAAVRDIINVAKRRNKNVDILIYPAAVQGKGSSEEIIRGIQYLNTINDVDVIILARGGGSIEELWSFNDEALAYTIYKSKKPIISGIGHETDFTISDFVSDRRAPTPSAAAEIAIPSLEEFNGKISAIESRIERLVEGNIVSKKALLDRLKGRLELNNPVNYIVNGYNYVDNLKNRLNHSIQMSLGIKEEQLRRVSAVINAHNPLNVLNKGYAVLQDNSSNVISNIDVLKKQEEILITLKDGKILINVDFRGE